MNYRIAIASLLGIALLTGGLHSSDRADARKPAEPRVRILVPAYFYPAGNGLKEWDRLLAASANARIVAIVNPASGPGKKADANYLKVIARAKKTPITLIGYITTSYGKRPLADVKADVDTWVRLYPGIAGIFFDEQASGEDKVEYYGALYKYVLDKPGLKRVVTNPGTVCSEKYLSRPATDTACLFEGAKAFDPGTFPAWVKNYSADRLYVLSYKIKSAKEMKRLVQTAVEKKIGYLFITDAEGANPWDRLPSYWEEEVKEVQRAR